MKKAYIKDEDGGWLRIGGTGGFSVFRTFDCGQCFRFDPAINPTFENEVEGVAMGKYVRFADSGEGDLMIKTSASDFENIWRDYLDTDTDYSAADKVIENAVGGSGGEHMRRAAEASRGIHILRQEKWETLCSFIISQNNNIPRIKKIIGQMCRTFGEEIEDGYAFPTPLALCEAGEDAIFDLKTGFRAKYIYDAARKVESGELDLEKVALAGTYEEAAQMLCGVSGVGPKVAACTLLFGFARLDAFPVDVWIKRVISRRFPDGLDPAAFGKWAGLAQQYLFYYERYIGD